MRAAVVLRQAPAIAREVLLAPGLRSAALLILPYAGVLVGLDVAARYAEVLGEELPWQFFLSNDEGFGEYLEYSLLSATAVMLLLMAWRDRSPLYFVNALLFAWLAADDALQVHEDLGGWLSPMIGRVVPAGLPIDGQHLGEPVVSLAICAIWLTGLALGLRQARLRPLVYSLILVGCVFAMGFFGVVVDTLDEIGHHTALWANIWAFVEDGGEFAMIIASFIVTVAMFDLERSRAKVRQALTRSDRYGRGSGYRRGYRQAGRLAA